MTRIRTDRHALFLAFAMATAFFFFCVRNYILVLPGAINTWDRLLLWCAALGALYFFLFALGHTGLRRAGVGARGAYAALGAVACLASFAAVFPDLPGVFQRGVAFQYSLLPAAAGAIFGFLYAFRAGWQADDETPQALAKALADRSDPTAVSEDRSVVGVGADQYFSGPVQVRTSIPIMFVAALQGGVLFGLLRGVLLISRQIITLGDVSLGRMVEHGVRASGAAGFELAALTIVSTLPMTVMVLGGHYLARGLKATSPFAYAGIGLAVPILLIIATLGLFLPFALLLLLPTVLSMALYRHFAGLEPTPVREDVRVRNARDLVGSNHPRRTYGRVVKG